MASVSDGLRLVPNLFLSKSTSVFLVWPYSTASTSPPSLHETFLATVLHVPLSSEPEQRPSSLFSALKSQIVLTNVSCSGTMKFTFSEWRSRLHEKKPMVLTSRKLVLPCVVQSNSAKVEKIALAVFCSCSRYTPLVFWDCESHISTCHERKTTQTSKYGSPRVRSWGGARLENVCRRIGRSVGSVASLLS